MSSSIMTINLCLMQINKRTKSYSNWELSVLTLHGSCTHFSPSITHGSCTHFCLYMSYIYLVQPSVMHFSFNVCQVNFLDTLLMAFSKLQFLQYIILYKIFSCNSCKRTAHTMLPFICIQPNVMFSRFIYFFVP